MTAHMDGCPSHLRPKLQALADDYPERDFWYVTVVVGPDAWCTRPTGKGTSDLVRYSAEEMRAALPPLSANRPLPHRVRP